MWLVCAASHLQNTSVRDFEALLQHLLKPACNIASTQHRQTCQPIIQYSLLNCTRLVCLTTQVYTTSMQERRSDDSSASVLCQRCACIFFCFFCCFLISAKQVLFACVIHALQWYFTMFSTCLAVNREMKWL